MSVRLIAIDIDGTLMPSSGPRIGQRNLAALRTAEAAGLEIVIATGRRQAYAMPLIAPLGLSHDSIMVSSNGAVIRHFSGNLIDRQFLEAEAARRLSSELRSYGTLVFTFDREGAGGLVIENLERLHTQIERWVEANRAHLLEVDPIERAFDGEELPIQGMVCGTPDEMKRAEDGLRAAGLDGQIAMHRTEYPVRNLSILDLLPAGCSKGAAIHQLAQLRNLAREEIMAIGDNLNDLEMLEYAGHAVVMANASREMLAIARERGWELTASNDEDGVAVAVESVLRGSSLPVKPPKGDTEGVASEDTMAGWV